VPMPYVVEVAVGRFLGRSRDQVGIDVVGVGPVGDHPITL
jgi:hypothetical protein